MSFDRLTGNACSRILLANLHNTAYSGLVDASLLKRATTDLYSRLSALARRPRHKTILKAFGDVFHAKDPDYKITASELLDLNERFALVIDLSKVANIFAPLARTLKQTDPGASEKLRSACAEGASKATIDEAVAILNLNRKISTLQIANSIFLIWAAPLDAIEGVLANPALPGDARATRLRDILGLVHIDPSPTEIERHLFLFRSDCTFKELRAIPSPYAVARPTTFDGFDNPRFCQRALAGRKPGWGNTVDLAAGTCGVGLPEVVLSSMPISHFTCEYLGEIAGSRFSTDGHYFDILAPSPPDAVAMAADLDSLAITP